MEKDVVTAEKGFRRTCETCRYAAVGISAKDDHRLCRRRAPVVVSCGIDGVPYAIWPEVGEQDWCGEFERRGRDADQTQAPCESLREPGS